MHFCKHGDILNESTFMHYLADGSKAEEEGFYYMVDGGYTTYGLS
jgi:hypothetical protein